MIAFFSLAAATLVFLVSAIQVKRFRRLHSRLQQPGQHAASRQLPPVAVLLTLRGSDPFLIQCLKALSQQQYSDYEVFVMVDHPDDPANETIQRFTREHDSGRFHFSFLADRLSSCTLVNQSYAALVETLDPRFEYIVTVDADSIPWKTWLAELVEPLTDDSVGLTSGNRWFVPARLTIGSLVRMIWNSFAVLHMAEQNLVWGGSMAAKSRHARHPDMLQRWRTSCSSDTTIYQFVTESGDQTRFNPSIMVINTETTRLLDFLNWLPRQLMNARLYNKRWKYIMLQEFLGSMLLLVAFALLCLNSYLGSSFWCCILGFSLLHYWLGCWWAVCSTNQIVCRIGKSKTGEIKSIGMAGNLLIGALAPFALWAYSICVSRSQLINRVSWRGIQYRINSPFDVKMLNYQPFYRNSRTSQDASL